VYKARDPQIDRLVAVKTVSLHGQEDEVQKEFRLRFINEAQAAGRLHHPGIVSVFDVGEDTETGDPYIVLEYVSGEPLNRVLARERKLSLGRALQIAEEIAQALDYAHEQGVTHRDVKPGNIMITDDGHAKIADFGIAKLNLAHCTLPGKLLGTPAYMAPEQLAGEGADGRSDLFSVGVILYAMVTGHSPFQGDSATTVCFKVANREPVPASALDLDLPRDLDGLIAKAMAKDPDRRYQYGAELAEDLAALRARRLPGATARPGTKVGTHQAKSALNGRPTTGLAYGWKLISTRVLRTPTRTLAFGLVTVLLLIILGVRSKVLVLNQQAVDLADPPPALKSMVPAVQAPAAVAPPAVSAGNESEGSTQTARGTSPASVAQMTPKVSRNIPARTAVPSSILDLAIRHQFKEATLFVWIDGKLALKRDLHGGAQKRLVVFGSVRGAESETLHLPAGTHEIRLRVLTDDHTADLSRTISANLAAGDEKTLQISFDKHSSSMHLDWQ
jgi:hypothetical protein